MVSVRTVRLFEQVLPLNYLDTHRQCHSPLADFSIAPLLPPIFQEQAEYPDSSMGRVPLSTNDCNTKATATAPFHNQAAPAYPPYFPSNTNAIANAKLNLDKNYDTNSKDGSGAKPLQATEGPNHPPWQLGSSAPKEADKQELTKGSPAASVPDAVLEPLRNAPQPQSPTPSACSISHSKPAARNDRCGVRAPSGGDSVGCSRRPDSGAGKEAGAGSRVGVGGVSVCSSGASSWSATNGNACVGNRGSTSVVMKAEQSSERASRGGPRAAVGGGVSRGEGDRRKQQHRRRAEGLSNGSWKTECAAAGEEKAPLSPSRKRSELFHRQQQQLQAQNASQAMAEEAARLLLQDSRGKEDQQQQQQEQEQSNPPRKEIEDEVQQARLPPPPLTCSSPCRASSSDSDAEDDFGSLVSNYLGGDPPDLLIAWEDVLAGSGDPLEDLGVVRMQEELDEAGMRVTTEGTCESDGGDKGNGIVDRNLEEKDEEEDDDEERGRKARLEAEDRPRARSDSFLVSGVQNNSSTSVSMERAWSQSVDVISNRSGGGADNLWRPVQDDEDLCFRERNSRVVSDSATVGLFPREVISAEAQGVSGNIDMVVSGARVGPGPRAVQELGGTSSANRVVDLTTGLDGEVFVGLGGFMDGARQLGGVEGQEQQDGGIGGFVGGQKELFHQLPMLMAQTTARNSEMGADVRSRGPSLATGVSRCEANGVGPSSLSPSSSVAGLGLFDPPLTMTMGMPPPSQPPPPSQLPSSYGGGFVAGFSDPSAALPSGARGGPGAVGGLVRGMDLGWDPFAAAAFAADAAGKMDTEVAGGAGVGTPSALLYRRGPGGVFGTEIARPPAAGLPAGTGFSAGCGWPVVWAGGGGQVSPNWPPALADARLFEAGGGRIGCGFRMDGDVPVWQPKEG